MRYLDTRSHQVDVLHPKTYVRAIHIFRIDDIIGVFEKNTNENAETNYKFGHFLCFSSSTRTNPMAQCLDRNGPTI